MTARINFEKYWAQTRAVWVERIADPYGSSELVCGFCLFSAHKTGCELCPVFRVYGDNCETVASVEAYSRRARPAARAGIEELRILARAVVQELDDRKEELIAAMQELWEEEQDELQTDHL